MHLYSIVYLQFNNSTAVGFIFFPAYVRLSFYCRALSIRTKTTRPLLTSSHEHTTLVLSLSVLDNKDQFISIILVNIIFSTVTKEQTSSEVLLRKQKRTFC